MSFLSPDTKASNRFVYSGRSSSLMSLYGLLGPEKLQQLPRRKKRKLRSGSSSRTRFLLLLQKRPE